MAALWLWVVVDHGFVLKRNVCVCHVIYIYRRTECVYVICMRVGMLLCVVFHRLPSQGLPRCDRLPQLAG